MFYYIDTIEQTKGENDAVNEYGKREIVKDAEGNPASLDTVLSKFYKKCSDVSADIGKNHYYMDIKIVNSLGNIEKKDVLGKYFEG